MNNIKVKAAVKYIEGKRLAKIVHPYRGYIILAQSAGDLIGKSSQINGGHTQGFYTVEMVLKLMRDEKTNQWFKFGLIDPEPGEIVTIYYSNGYEETTAYNEKVDYSGTKVYPVFWRK